MNLLRISSLYAEQMRRLIYYERVDGDCSALVDQLYLVLRLPQPF